VMHALFTSLVFFFLLFFFSMLFFLIIPACIKILFVSYKNQLYHENKIKINKRTWNSLYTSTYYFNHKICRIFS
jgi:hypothetical protein